MSNRAAVDVLVGELARAERLDAGLGPLVEMCRNLADSVDSQPLNAALWREYRTVVELLRELFEANDITFSQIVAGLRTEVPNRGDQKT